MALVSSTRVRRAHHVDVGHVGIVSLNVALQLAQKRVMRLSWIGERLRCVCLWHTTNYAELRGRPREKDRHLDSTKTGTTSATSLAVIELIVLGSGCGCPTASRRVR
jgi:hypothetical protein